jgi:hypothetical protein
VRERRSPRDMVRDCARSSRAEPAATGETPSAERRSLATLREGVAEGTVGEPGEVDEAGEAGMPMRAGVLSRCVACRLIAKEAGSYGLAEEQRRLEVDPEIGPGESTPARSPARSATRSKSPARKIPLEASCDGRLASVPPRRAGSSSRSRVVSRLSCNILTMLQHTYYELQHARCRRMPMWMWMCMCMCMCMCICMCMCMRMRMHMCMHML